MFYIQLGTIAHELMHAVGMIHEQQRPDRDGHIKINWQNMDEDSKPQFEKARESEIDDHDVPYDFSSLMHYSLDVSFYDSPNIFFTTFVYVTSTRNLSSFVRSRQSCIGVCLCDGQRRPI